MSVFHFPLSILHMLGLAAVSLLCGLWVWPQLVVAWPSIEEKIDLFRRLPPLAKLLLLLFVGAFVVYGSTKTNLVDQTSGTNGIVRLFGLFDCSIEETQPTVTPEDIARGWQMWEVRTNSDISYAMPEGATMASNWWVRGAFEDCSIVRLGDCSIVGYVNQSNNPNNQTMSFPFGTNEYDSVWAFSWGKVRFSLVDTNTEIVAIGAPMSAVPYRSRLWSAADTNDSWLITWENFALNRNTNTPVNAQVELRTTGDFVTRSNEVETVYRRVDPDDWDGDGWRNDDDYNPYVWDDCNDDFYQELPMGANSNAYCWIEVKPEWNTWIDFQGDDWSNLSDPCFTASAGRTYRIWLLIGKTYSVFAPMPVSVVGRSDERIEITDVTENSFTAVWPVTFTALEGNGKNFRMVVRPSKLNGVFDWCYSCCQIIEEGIGFRYACDGSCGCSGCQAEGEYRYEGYSLWAFGGSCGCPYHDGPDETAGVSVAFSDSVILFEDSYTNSYGQLVYGQTTRSRLTCVVHGGVHGGNFSVAVSGLDKLTVVGGGLLPTGDVYIAPQETRTFGIDLMGLKPSERKGDIVATAMFVEQDTGETHSDCAEMTCIEISTCVHCDWIPWKERKELGVGEKAIVIVEPDDVELGLSVQGCVSEYEQWIYRAPFRQEVDTVGVSCAGVTLQLRFVVEEPEIVLAVECYTNVTIGVGRAGGMSCDFDLRFMPTNVSFSAIETAELPRISTDATGYFAKSDLSYLLDHGQHGGGIWHGLLSGNRFFDRASVSELPREWNGGGSFTYPIPRAWRPSGVESDVHEVEHRSGYDQRMELDGDGTSRIIKFGYIVERMTNGVMTLTRSL